LDQLAKNIPPSLCLLGAIAGDVIGSVYEFNPVKHTHFRLFTPSSKLTDDSVLTLAVADAILNGGEYAECIRHYAQRFPNCSYGGLFRGWMYADDPHPYNSFGNGSAMRVSPVGWAFNTVEEVLREAEASAAVTHNHPEGIKGAQSVALAIFLARTGAGKDDIRQEITRRFGYDLSQALDDIRPSYQFDETCQGTVPPAMIAFFESDDFEDAIRKSISLGGDADTLAAITGSIAEAYYGKVPEEIVAQVRECMPGEMWKLVEKFSQMVRKRS
jgi:ADP-ribosylglycohydrolase